MISSPSPLHINLQSTMIVLRPIESIVRTLARSRTIVSMSCRRYSRICLCMVSVSSATRSPPGVT